MSEKNEYFKILAIIESHLILTNDGLYQRQQWPAMVEWWLMHGDDYDSTTKVDDEAAQRLEQIFRESK